MKSRARPRVTNAMDFLPIFLDIQGQPCLVVGGEAQWRRASGVIARRRARSRCSRPAGRGARRDLAAGGVAHRAASFATRTWGAALAIAATTTAVNRAVAAAARRGASR
jgi:uroporphyrin-III C-methyltransferase/precorrin-2 dehydrogenase/sirohydrochlorin ferrochelatase